MKTQNELKHATDTFFKLYWNPSNGAAPHWSEHWQFENTIPNHDKRGCYALFKGNEIIYIGVGIGKSFGTYHGSGLGDRLKRYWRLNKNEGKQYEPTSEWTDISSLITIGFDEVHYPLAAALEVYLIRELSPKRNSTHK
ncbi:MAG: hypothetical protein JXR07_19255 [Reichenbachiella sp.]